MQNIDLTGKTALVTGGSRGIGKAITETLEDAGAHVLAVDSNGYNLADPDEVDLLGCTWLDILVNNAGAQAFGGATYYTLDQWEKDIQLMLTAPFVLARTAAQGMMERHSGKIINIASIGGINGTRNTVGYSVAKAGLIHMTKCLSNEFAPYNIQVNAIAPGYIKTDMLRPLLDNEAHATQIIGRIPAGKFGEPMDVANAVLFLASPLSDYITGVCLPVDGGWLAR